MFRFLLILAFISSLQGISYFELSKKIESDKSIALEEANRTLHLGECDFVPMEGGLSDAKLYKFDLSGKKYVLRFMGDWPEEKRQNEVAALKIGYDLGMAPPCLFSDEKPYLLIMPFVEGVHFKEPNNSHLLKLGNMIRTLQEYQGFYPMRISFHERLKQHYEKGVLKNTAYPTGFGEQVNSVISKPRICQVAPAHGDLNPSNIIVNEEGLHLIDWTNATWDSPYSDLCYFSALANLNDDHEKILLEGYFGRPCTESELHAFREERFQVYLLTATIWLRFSESEEERLLPMDERVRKLNITLNSPDLKPVEEYLREHKVVNFLTAPKDEVKAYGLSFYKAFLDSQRNRQ